MDSRATARRRRPRRASGPWTCSGELVSEDGRLEVGLQCLERQQYFGMAQADVYFRARDASFPANFVKGYLGLWLQMGHRPGDGRGVQHVPQRAGRCGDAGAVAGGLFSSYIAELAGGARRSAAGRSKSFIRIVDPAEHDQGRWTGACRPTPPQLGDRVMQGLALAVCRSLLPGFEQLRLRRLRGRSASTSAVPGVRGAVASGAAAFLLPVRLAGYLFLKLREVAK